VTDGTQRIAVEQSGTRSEKHEVQEFRSEAFSELGRNLTQAIDQAIEQARIQASDIIRRAEQHATEAIQGTDRRIAEGLRQATAAERRATAAQDRLVDLERRIDLAQAKLSQLRASATEIIHLVTTTEALPAAVEMDPSASTNHPGSANLSSEHDAATTRADLDPLAALASLRDAVDATR
jgi:hypothetical protein